MKGKAKYLAPCDHAQTYARSHGHGEGVHGQRQGQCKKGQQSHAQLRC